MSSSPRSTTLQLGHPEATARPGHRLCGNVCSRRIDLWHVLVVDSLRSITRCTSLSDLEGNKVPLTHVVMDLAVVLLMTSSRGCGVATRTGTHGTFKVLAPLHVPPHGSSTTYLKKTVTNCHFRPCSLFFPFAAAPRGVRDHCGHLFGIGGTSFSALTLSSTFRFAIISLECLDGLAPFGWFAHSRNVIAIPMVLGVGVLRARSFLRRLCVILLTYTC